MKLWRSIPTSTRYQVASAPSTQPKAAATEPATSADGFAASFKDLKEGDLCVHAEFGVCRYGGLVTMQVNQVSADFLVLEFHGKDKVYLPVVEMANETLDHLVVHARHAQQRSRDLPTWSAIGEAKAHAKIPIIGNGDVRTRADAERMHKETGCDGFMIARAAIFARVVVLPTPVGPTSAMVRRR